MQSATIVPFRNSKLLLANHEGQPFVPMKPVVEGMGLAWQSQHAKLKSGRLNSTITEIVIVAEDGKQREMTCLPLRKLPGWLMSIYPNKVRPDLRDGIIAYQNECDDVLWSYWNNGVAVNHHHNGDASTILNATIGTDGFHMLGAIIKGKVVSLPQAVQRRATAKIWSQTHAAFGVRSAADIPADQLDAARNFIAAYALEGEWLPKRDETPRQGTLLTDHQLYDVWFVSHHFECLYEIFQRYSLHAHLTGLGSRSGIEMIGHFRDGYLGVIKLKKLSPEFDAAQHRLGLNQYRLT